MSQEQTADPIVGRSSWRRAIPALVPALVCLGLTASECTSAQVGYPFQANSGNADLLAYWYPVPSDSLVMLLDPEHALKFSSLLQVYGAVPGDRFDAVVEVRRESEVLFTRRFAIDRANPATDFEYTVFNGYFRIDAKTEYRQDRPTAISVTIVRGTDRWERTVECRYHTIKGSIRDIDDRPLRAFFSVGPDEFALPIAIWSDAQGQFSIDLPERTYNTFYVDDQTYGVSTQEMWGWHMVVDRDETYDFIVGNGEVYNLHAWPNDGGYDTYFVYFRPMVLPLQGAAATRTTLNERDFEVTDTAPPLTPDDVTVRINGKRIEIVSVQEVFETGLENNAGGAMPAYLLQVMRNGGPVNGRITLSLEYDARITVEEREVRVRAVGYTQFYPQFAGQGFY
jgi:hypothetical protein